MLNRGRIDGMRSKDWSWYSVQAREGDGGEIAVSIDIFDEISPWGASADSLVPQIRALPPTAALSVAVNSPGGDVFEGYAIANALRAHPGPVTTRVQGVAASIASVIFAAGDERLMHEESMLMWHRAWGVAIGNAKDHEDLAATLRQIDGQLVGVYQRTSTLDADAIESMIDAETWLTPQDAADIGHANMIESPDAQAALRRFDLSNYKNVPGKLSEIVSPESLAQAQAEVEQDEGTARADRERHLRRLELELEKRRRSIA